MSSPSNGTSSTKIVLIILAVLGGGFLLLLLVCAGLGFLAFRSAGSVMTNIQAEMAKENEKGLANSKKVAEGFVAALKNGKADDAYELTTEDFHEKQTEQQFKAFIDKHPGIEGAKDISINLVSSDFLSHKYNVIVTTQDGRIIIGTLELTQQEGDWLIEKLSIP